MAETKKETPKLTSGHIDLIFIGIGIFLVISIWVFFPSYLVWKDSVQPEQKTQIVIPYKLDTMLKTKQATPEPLNEDKEKTELQVIGDQFGAFGDSYGSLNTLFSGLAFTFLVASLYLQRKELQAQRLEISDQRVEIKRGNDIAEGQRKIAENQEQLIRDQISEGQKQNFYSLFFRFLDEKNKKMQNLVIKSRNPAIPDRVGDYFFKVFAGEFLKDLLPTNIPHHPQEDGSLTSNLGYLVNKIEGTYERLSTYNHVNFEETFYFEYFIFLLNFINQNEFIHDSDLVMDTFISHLTFNETICMACYAALRNTELKNYIERYGLLRNLNLSLLTQAQLDGLKTLYLESAFTAPKKSTLDFLFNDSDKDRDHSS